MMKKIITVEVKLPSCPHVNNCSPITILRRMFNRLGYCLVRTIPILVHNDIGLYRLYR